MDVAIGDVALSLLFSKYSRIIATLSNPYLTQPVALDLETIRAAVGGSDSSFNNFLVDNGNKTLLTMDHVPTITPRFAKYADAFHAGYKIAPIHPLAAPDAQLPLSEKTWLHLTRPDTDYELFHRSCLVSVNGYYHLTDASTAGIYVEDGMRSAFISRQNQIGLYSFRELGTITQYPITADMVYKQNTRQAYLNRAYVDLQVDLTDKTVMLVLGGYLHVLDNKTFYRVSATAFAIDFGNLPFLERFYESRDYLDLSSLPLETTTRNPSQISVSNFFSDENILAYLTLSQSFFVVLDAPDIFVNQLPVKTSMLPDMFVSYQKPEYPLIVGYGKTANYWTTYEDGQYALACHDTRRANRLFETVDVKKQHSVSDAKLPLHPYTSSAAYLLEVGCDI